MKFIDQLITANKKENINNEIEYRKILYEDQRKCSICDDYKSKTNFVVKNKKRGWLDTRCNDCKRVLLRETMQKLRSKQ